MEERPAARTKKTIPSPSQPDTAQRATWSIVPLRYAAQCDARQCQKQIRWKAGHYVAIFMPPR